MSNDVDNADLIGSWGIFGRFMFYIFLYVLVWLIMVFILSDNQESLFSNNETVNNTISFALLFGVPTIIPFFIEKSIRAFRKEKGISIYKPIKLKDLEQMEVDERVAMEKKAYEKAGVHQSVDKNDIGYWFDLKEKGAINEDEFLEKKEELLKK